MKKTIVLGFAMAVLSGCVVAQADDGFRARLAQGCNSSQECSRLRGEAGQRLARCKSSCQKEAEDEAEAGRLWEAQRTARQPPVVEPQPAASSLATSLSHRPAISEDEHRCLSSGPKNLNWWPNQDDHIRSLERNVDVERAKDLDAVVPAIAARARSEVAKLRCPTTEIPEWVKINEGVEAWVAKLEAQVAEEKACRQSDDCMAKRYAGPLCDAIDSKRWAQKEMARERANPSGTVNLTALNTLGRQVQDADDTIAEKRKEYAAKTKKPFSEGMCKKP